MSFKFQVPGFPPNWADTAGLRFRSYSVYSGSASESPNPTSLVSGSLRTVSGASTQISSFAVSDDTTYVWRGYFKPDASSTSWQFKVTSEDGAYLWLDSAAEGDVAALNRANAIVDNGGTHGSEATTSGNQNLDSEFHYAITLIAGSTGGSGTTTLEWSRDGGAFTSDGAGYLEHDSRYPDGIGGNLYTASAGTQVQWGIVGEDGAVGYGSGSSPTGWTGYRSPNSSNSNDHTDIGYGKDGSGDGLWVRTTSNNNLELAYSSDITDSWTSVNVTGRRYNVKWSNDKWIAVGTTSQNDILTSTDGATWSSVDISGLTGLSGTDIYALATDGGNNWIFGQDDRVYTSRDHGVNWQLLKDFNDGSNIREAAYSNNKWFVLRTDVGGSNAGEKVGVASSASSGSWTDSADTNIGDNAKAMFASISTGSASQSTVIVVNSDDMARSTDSGATFTRTQNCLPFGSANGIVSDGQGNWVVVHNGGDISYSNDDGATWSTGVENLIFTSGTEAIKAVAPDKILPL